MEAKMGDAAGATTIGKTHCLEDGGATTMTLCILSGSAFSFAAAAIFKLNIQVINNQDFIVSSSAEDKGVPPAGTFFEKTDESRLGMIAHCRFRDSPEKVYIFPSDTRVSIHKRNTASSSPLVFDCKADTTINNNLYSMPAAPKWDPIAAAIGDKIYLFSTGSLDHGPDPRFESYYPPLDKWSVLPPCDHLGTLVLGYVVLNDKFLVICVRIPRPDEHDAFYSYNTVSGEWKLVKIQIITDCERKEEKKYPTLSRQGTVLFESSSDGVIYTYLRSSQELYAFSYTVNTEDGIHDISLGLACAVKGFNSPAPKYTNARYTPRYNMSGGVAKLSYQNRNNILCVLHAFPYDPHTSLIESYGCIIELHDNDYGSCSILKTFPFNLFVGDRLQWTQIQDCFFLQLEEQKDDRPCKRLKDDLVPKEDTNIGRTPEDADEMEL